MQETHIVSLVAIGLVVFLIGSLWFLIRAFRTHLGWGLLVLAFPFLGHIAFASFHLRKALVPLILIVVGATLGGVPLTFGPLQDYFLHQEGRFRWMEGDQYLNLTGWSNRDYSILKRKRDIAVLELGNADVTDGLLVELKEMPYLKELTLNDSQVSDQAFGTLRSLEKLQRLRMARTKITKEGLESFLADPPPELKEIDVSGNKIPTSVLRKWKNADPENRDYLNR